MYDFKQYCYDQSGNFGPIKLYFRAVLELYTRYFNLKRSVTFLDDVVSGKFRIKSLNLQYL